MIEPKTPLSQETLQRIAMPAIIVASNHGAHDHDAKMVEAVAGIVAPAVEARTRELLPFQKACLALLEWVGEPDANGFYQDGQYGRDDHSILWALAEAGVLHETPDGYVPSRALIAARQRP